MSKQTLAAVFIGLAVVAALVTGILFGTRKNRVELTGEILKVRSHQIDPEHTMTVIDVRISNPSTQQFVVREVEIFVDENDGNAAKADIFSETDLNRVIGYYPALGKKYNPGLLRRDKINSGATLDRSLGFSAPMTDERLQKRKSVRMIVHDVDGASAVITERKP